MNWWVDYYYRDPEDKYFSEAYSTTDYGEIYESVRAAARYNRVTIAGYLLVFDEYFDKVYDFSPEYTCPLLLKDDRGTFVGYFKGGQLRVIQDYMVESLL